MKYLVINDSTFNGEHSLKIEEFNDKASARLQLAKLVKQADYAQDIPTVDEVGQNYYGQVIEKNTLDDFSAYLSGEAAVDYTHIYIYEVK